MKAIEKTRAVRDAIARRTGITLDMADADALRRAEITLHRWAEQECGGGNEYGSWAIERDETTGVTYRAVYPNTGKAWRIRTVDRERGALRRVADVCARNGLHFHHQGDPRGVALYVADVPLTDENYSNRGVAVTP